MSDIHQSDNFDSIYLAGGWDGQGSGPGSTEVFTREFRKIFVKLLMDRKIKSIFDLGCGDWQWQRHVKWPETVEDYMGCDVSKTAIAQALKAAQSPSTRAFVDCDAFQEPLWPEADLLLVKDVVHHITPFRARMLAEKARLYSHVLLVADVDSSRNWPVNWPLPAPLGKRVFEFDCRLPYGYGPKAAFLLTNE